MWHWKLEKLCFYILQYIHIENSYFKLNTISQFECISLSNKQPWWAEDTFKNILFFSFYVWSYQFILAQTWTGCVMLKNMTQNHAISDKRQRQH